jgi:RPA family protein
MRREFAWRVFAAEFNDSQFEEKGTSEMAPSYVITPLGGKVNRMFLVGVLTDVEPVSEDGEFVRAHVSDPTGIFTLYSGQYQPEITEQLSSLEIPTFVAIMGKSRSYIPEEGELLYTSVRPQQIAVVPPKIRDEWIVETCYQTLNRLEAMSEVLKMSGDYETELQNLGFGRYISESIGLAAQRYDHVDIKQYKKMIKDALDYIIEGPSVGVDSSDISNLYSVKTDEKSQTIIPPNQQEISDEMQEAEDTVLEVIKTLEGKDGALWDKITEQCESKGLDVDMIEEALNGLMEKGLIYEPVLGTIKTT